jgi:hypothetical protein
MLRRQAALLFFILTFSLFIIALPVQASAQEGVLRALFVACQNFLSQPSMSPSSSNNVALVSRAFSSGATMPDALFIEDGTIATLDALRAAVQEAYRDATEQDVSLFYLSTHGVYDAKNADAPPVLLLSDGQTETAMTAEDLRAILDEIPGTKLLILDACNSGAFIGKGMDVSLFSDGAHAFSSPEYKVLTSCGGSEQSWYWDLHRQDTQYGSSYFAIALSQALRNGAVCPGDADRDGAITLDELYQYILRTQPTSTVQVYPQNDTGFVVFRPDENAAAAEPLLRDVSFENTVLSMQDPEITFSYTVTRPVRVLYQLVYTQHGIWDWPNAQLIYDDMLVASDAVLQPGRVERTISLGGIDAESSGYALLQLIAVGDNGPEVYEGRVLCVQPIVGNPQLRLTAGASFSPLSGRELPLSVGSDFPVNLTVSVSTASGVLVRRLAVQHSMRPLGLEKESASFYWDGLDKNGAPVPAGFYTLKAETTVGGTRYETTLENIYVSSQALPVQLTPIG